jgi:hypothetical protein
MSLTTNDLNTIIKKVVLAYSAVSPAKRQNLVSTFREVHRVPSTLTCATPDASDAATLYALVIALKALVNTHFAAATYHRAADATNSVDTATANSEATAITMVNELKLDINAHMIQSGVHMVDDTANRITIADAVDFATCYLLGNQIKSKFNAHLSAETDGRWVYIKDIVDAAEIDATAGSGVTRDEIRSQIRALIPNRPPVSVVTYTITSSAGSNGAIDPLGAVVVASGDEQGFAIDADAGTYYIGSVEIDDVAIDLSGAEHWVCSAMDEYGNCTSGTYTFYDVGADHTIAVTFSQPG